MKEAAETGRVERLDGQRLDARPSTVAGSAAGSVDRSPVLAAALSFVWPGLGQWYAGRARRALLFALPVLALVVIVALQAAGGLERLAALLFVPSFSLAAMVVFVVAGGWRLAAMVDAYRAALGRAPARAGRLAPIVVVALSSIVLVSHALAASYAYAFFHAGPRIFVSDGQGAAAVGPSTGGGRLTALFVGVDSRPWRGWENTDTLLVVSLDRADGTVTMLSLPRDIAELPLSDGTIYKRKINSLMSFAAAHPERFPAGPTATLRREVGHLIGIPIDYYASVDLPGLLALIDAVGGVEVDNESPIRDSTYKFEREDRGGFYLEPGVHHLNGWAAIAYVRSRKDGGSDLLRASRQQEVLVNLRRKLADPGTLLRLPAVLSAAAEAVRTNVPAEELDDFLALAREMGDGTNTVRHVLGPPQIHHPPRAETGGSWIYRVRMEEMARLSVELFGEDSRYAD
ncbi:hypothetical protein BH20CHL6_BH20CHL6_17860 [soil metagenome]